MRFEVQKTHYFPHTVHYSCSSMPRLSETHRFLQSSSFWEARCALIGQLSSALWLAEYLKRVMEMLRPLPCCDAVSRHDDTKTIKPTINIETYLQAVSQKHQTVLAMLELPHFIVFTAIQCSHCRLLSPRIRKQSSVKCTAHTRIFALYCSGTVL